MRRVECCLCVVFVKTLDWLVSEFWDAATAAREKSIVYSNRQRYYCVLTTSSSLKTTKRHIAERYPSARMALTMEAIQRTGICTCVR